MIGAASMAAAPAAAPAAAAPAAAAPTTSQTWQLIGKDVFTGDAAGARSQGVTTDGTDWYFSSSDGLEITDMQYNTLFTSSPAIPPELANPSPLADKGLNHIGDMDYANGKLYIALDSSAVDPNTGPPLDGINQFDTPVFATYSAADLSFTGHAAALDPPHGVNDIASWTAVDAKKGLAYGMEFINGTEIAVYNLPNWTFSHYIELSQPVVAAQGGKVHDGWIYFSSDDPAKTISRANLKTGQVQVLFHLKVPFPQEVEGLAFLQTPSGLTLNILDREQPDPTQPGNVTFYHYRLVPPQHSK
ncbi:MAG: hypothetical protein J2P57_02340 [Acidimicrobiaceae bacterium]|nr:hypothetical protein [Acidimicrobiaceae bacterium]